MRTCTIATTSQLPHARVLAASLARHGEPAPTVLLLDDVSRSVSARDEPFELMRPEDLDLEAGRFERLALLLGERRLARSLVPALLRRLLRRTGEDEVLFLRPNQALLAPLDEIPGLLKEAGIVVVARTQRPLPLDGRTPTDGDLVVSGLISDAMLAVDQSAEGFLEWWWDRIEEDALREDPSEGWLDVGARQFGAVVWGDPGVAAGLWNLHGRDVAIAGDRASVAGEALRLLDLDGFSPDRPHLLSEHQGPKPRVLLSEMPGLRELCDRYAAELRAHGYGDFAEAEYGFARLPNGIPVDEKIRELYREHLAGEALFPKDPPNPFVRGGSSAFIDWLNEPIFGGTVTRYLYAVYRSRLDVQGAYPDPAGPGFIAWVRNFGVHEERIPKELMPVDVPPTRAERPPLDGINVVGFLRAEVGLGAAGRTLLECVREAGVPSAVVSLPHPIAPDAQEVAAEGSGSVATHGINVTCGTPDLALAMAQELGTHLFEDYYNVGFWFWEAESFRPHILRALELTDEVWAPTRYIADAVNSVFEIPTHVFPVPFSAPQVVTTLPREELGLPEGFLFLFMFDYSSVFERKNPLQLIEAFTRAFEPGEGPVLAIKSMFGERHLVDRERLRHAASGRDDIILLEGVWPEERKNALMATCDCYVSLHRSEGLGLTMAEAMLLGKPAIATGYSGNMDFMTEENSYLVRHGMTIVGEGVEPYDPSWRWAAPDLDHAAALMREVYENQDAAAERGFRAREELLRERSVARAAAFVKERFDAIRSDPGPPDRDEASAPEIGGTQRPTGVEELRSLIERGPDPATPVRFGWLGRAIRKIVLYLLRPYDRHQREVQRRLLDVVEGAEPSSDGG